MSSTADNDIAIFRADRVDSRTNPPNLSRYPPLTRNLDMANRIPMAHEPKFDIGDKVGYLCRYNTENRVRSASRRQYIFWAAANSYFDLVYAFYTKCGPVLTQGDSNNPYDSDLNGFCRARKNGSRKKTNQKIERMAFDALHNWHGYMQNGCLHSFVCETMLMQDLEDIERLTQFSEDWLKEQPEDEGLMMTIVYLRKMKKNFTEDREPEHDCFDITL